MNEIGALSVDEVAKLYGVSSSTIEREIIDGKLDAVKIRGARRILRRHLIEWERRLAAKQQPSTTNPFF